MGHDHSHHHVLEAAMHHLRPIFDHSPDGVYVWVDPENTACNEHLATMFGRSVAEWEASRDFLGDFIHPDDQAMYGGNYQKHVGGLTRPVTFRFRGVRKDGSIFDAETDMVPLVIEGHAVAYHFVRLV